MSSASKPGNSCNNKTSNNKRQRQYSGPAGSGRRSKSSRSRNPRRGGPGFVLTCEAGREVKCAREAQDIISHYFQASNVSTAVNDAEEKGLLKLEGVSIIPLSLDEEISLLRHGASADQILQDENKNNQPPFEQYETGCRGVVVLILHSNNTETVDNNEKETVVSEGENSASQVIVSSSNQISATFDPVALVKNVIKDLNEEEKDAPRSRFVTRMIPFQISCYANVDEISKAAKQLIDSRFQGTPLHDIDPLATRKFSFEVVFKKRLCSSVTREECIELVARHFDEERFKVDLTNPEYSFIMEVCKSLVCMSIVHNFKSTCHNFNLVQISEKVKELHHSSNDDAAGGAV